MLIKILLLYTYSHKSIIFIQTSTNFSNYSFANLLPCVNSAANFLVYMLRGEKFRSAFVRTYKNYMFACIPFSGGCCKNEGSNAGSQTMYVN